MKRLYHYRPMLVLAIFASLFAVLTEALIFCSTMVFNTDYYVWTISNSGADKALYHELDDYFNQYSSPTGIPKEVYTKSLNEEKVSATAKKLTRSSLEYMFGRSLAKPEVDYDYTDFENDVTEYVEKHAEANNIEMDKEYYAFIDNTIDVAEKKVNSSFDILMAKKLATSSSSSVLKRIVPELSLGIGICIVVLAVLLGLMFYIDRHHPFDMPYWFGTIFFACGALFLIPSLYCRLTGYFDGLFMEDQSIYYAITGAIYGVTNRLILVNGILFALGIVLMIFAQVIHIFRVREAKLYSHEHHHA
ncbi:hypothetical protein SAMN02910406_03702 [Ruminococcus albus]|uniref:Uncharacterized protein n=2 Tax=Ruminococcus albus TaxID=1264 RepID=A0A1I1RI40_RUMAL|nr:hypothetical protein SAMN02910406_03702 [Ruminococcus albus]